MKIGIFDLLNPYRLEYDEYSKVDKLKTGDGCTMAPIRKFGLFGQAVRLYGRN